MQKIAIIGAGISGLILADMLSDKFEITIYEKSRSVGGRMATRRANDFIFDHGAPFFTSKTNEFQDYIIPYIKKGIVDQFNARFARIIDYKLEETYKWGDKPKHYVSSPFMTSFPKYLAEKINIDLSTKITQIRIEGNKKLLFAEGGNKGSFDYVITSIPPHQAYDILPNDCRYKSSLQKVEMLPCYSLMLGFDKPLDIDFDTAIVKGGDISFITIMNSKPQRSSNYAVSVLSTNLWAKNNLTCDKIYVIDHMKLELGKLLNCNMENIIYEDLHKWKYANICKQSGPKFLFDEGLQIGSIGDWCIEGKVEGGFLSALSMAQKLKEIPLI